METRKALCITCQQENGIAICVGCYKIFCYEHLAQHRHELNKVLDDIVITDNRVTKLLEQQLTDESEEHPLIKRINDWEDKSIEKIRQTAENARSSLLNKIPHNLLEIRTILDNLTFQVEQVRRNNGFLESDLNDWQDKLRRIQEQLEILENFQIEDPSSILVNNLRADISSLAVVFEQVVEITTLDDNINNSIRPRTESRLEVYGKYELIGGQRTYRFKIEALDKNRWIFFGVNSVISEMNEFSGASKENGNSSDQVKVYQAGAGINLPTAGVLKDDIIRLLIDSDQRFLRLTHERTNDTLEMPVDLVKCPLPWQLHLNLHQGSTRLRVI